MVIFHSYVSLPEGIAWEADASGNWKSDHQIWVARGTDNMKAQLPSGKRLQKTIERSTIF